MTAGSAPIDRPFFLISTKQHHCDIGLVFPHGVQPLALSSFIHPLCCLGPIVRGEWVVTGRLPTFHQCITLTSRWLPELRAICLPFPFFALRNRPSNKTAMASSEDPRACTHCGQVLPRVFYRSMGSNTRGETQRCYKCKVVIHIRALKHVHLNSDIQNGQLLSLVKHAQTLPQYGFNAMTDEQFDSSKYSHDAGVVIH